MQVMCTTLQIFLPALFYRASSHCLFLPITSRVSSALCCSEFCAGAGQLHVFCPQAPELLDRLLSIGRVQRLLSSPLPSPPPLHRGARRLSRSEGDLYCFTGKENKALGSPRQHHNFLRHKAVLERSHSSSRTSATSDDYVQAIGGKVTMVLDL
jgi:hypothetical protein